MPKFSKSFFERGGQAVITRHNALKHITKAYLRFKIETTNYKILNIPQKVIIAVITRDNALQHFSKD